MKLLPVISTTVALLLTQSALAAPYPSVLNGAWWNEDKSGQGLVIEQVEYPSALDTPQLQVYWYTYDDEGDPIYLVGAGDYVDGRATVALSSTRGGRHGNDLDPTQIVSSDWGSATITGLSCERIEVQYTPLGGATESISMSRFSTALGGATVGHDCTLIDPPARLGTASVRSCDIFGCRSVSLPTSGSGSVNTSVVGNRPADYKVMSYTLTAQGGDVIVSYIGVNDSRPNTRAYISGVQQGQRIPSGTSVEIELRSAWTGGVTENLRYKLAFTYEGFEGSAQRLSIDRSVSLTTN